MEVWIINHYAMPPKYEMRVRSNMMAKYLQEFGHNVKIFSASTLHNTNMNLITEKKILYIKKKYDGLNFIHIKTISYSGNGLLRMLNMFQFPIRLSKVSKLIDVSPDIIICDLGTMLSPIVYFISRRFKARFVKEIRDLWPESIIEYKDLSRKNPLVKAMYSLEKWVYKKADKLIFSMEGGKDYVIDKGWENSVDLSKIHYVNNGVDLDIFNFNKLEYICKDDDLLDTNIFKVIYTGSIRLANNVRKIVEAAEILQKRNFKNVKFLIYGDGSDREYLERFCKENYITNVIFKGHVEKNKIPFILSNSDLNILHFEQNSLKKYGVSLNKMFEYFASGKPTVSDCEFGYDLLNKYGAGISIDTSRPEELADIIINFYRMPALIYQNYCRNALYAAKNFDYKILMKQFDNIINDKA